MSMHSRDRSHCPRQALPTIPSGASGVFPRDPYCPSDQQLPARHGVPRTALGATLARTPKYVRGGRPGGCTVTSPAGPPRSLLLRAPARARPGRPRPLSGNRPRGPGVARPDPPDPVPNPPSETPAQPMRGRSHPRNTRARTVTPAKHAATRRETSRPEGSSHEPRRSAGAPEKRGGVWTRVTPLSYS